MKEMILYAVKIYKIDLEKELKKTNENCITFSSTTLYRKLKQSISGYIDKYYKYQKIENRYELEKRYVEELIKFKMANYFLKLDEVSDNTKKEIKNILEKRERLMRKAEKENEDYIEFLNNQQYEFDYFDYPDTVNRFNRVKLKNEIMYFMIKEIFKKITNSEINENEYFNDITKYENLLYDNDEFQTYETIELKEKFSDLKNYIE